MRSRGEIRRYKARRAASKPVDSLGHECGCAVDVDRGVGTELTFIGLGLPQVSGAAVADALRPEQWDGETSVWIRESPAAKEEKRPRKPVTTIQMHSKVKP